VQALLEEIQNGLLERARDRMEKGTREVNTWEEFTAGLEEGGFLSAHWDGTAETEELIKKETKATIRCIPLQGDTTPGNCIRTGAPSARRVLFARAY
jgi:prolyl-tRNA synthetase